MVVGTAEVTEIAGVYRSITSMRKPTKTVGDSILHIGHTLSSPDCIIGEKDMKLAKHLVSKGPVHGKFTRGMHVWMEINAPRYLWSEIDTYTVGVSPISSESTMYTLIKESVNITSDMFHYTTPIEDVMHFSKRVEQLGDQFGSRQEIPIDVIKSILPEGWMQKREKVFSYQGLGQLYKYRRKHRLEAWKPICDTIEGIPYFKELIYCGVE
jgi:hypothetical protein